MADSKITALDNLTTADPANDMIPIVDVSATPPASGNTKRISINNLLACSPSATLASATISGALGAAGLNVTGATIPANGVYLGSANNLSFSAASTLGMTLNSTGLGVGVSPSYKLDVQGSGIRLNSGSATGFAILRLGGTASDSFLGFAGNANDIVTGSSAGDTVVGSNKAGANLRFISGNGVLNATLDASGNLLVGKTARNLTTAGVEILPTGQTTVTVASSVGGFTTSEVYSTTAAEYRFYVGMNGTVSATNTTISAISDARLKENVQDIDVGLGAILALKPRKFDWKEGKGKNIKGDRGFIAQEFETVFPNLIDEWKDAAPEGEAPYKSVRQDLIPVLVKAIQELTARVQTLEAK